MKRKTKFDWTWIIWIIGILLIFWGISNLKLNINIPQQNLSLSVAPNSQTPVYNSCNQVCSSNGFTKYYNFVSSCKAGESKVTYGYPNQVPILTCCCVNENIIPEVTCGNSYPTCGGTCPAGEICNKLMFPQGHCVCIKSLTHTCSETDGGNVNTVPGTTTGDGVARMDYCFDATTVYEYWCNGNEWNGGKSSCASGEVCLATRSGGVCRLKTWNPGDTVWEGSGSASVIGTSPVTNSIDLSDYGISTNGNCRLGVQLSTSWNYANDRCVGYPGMQGVKWDFYDSNGLEYTRLDTAPVSLGVDISPATGHSLEWNGNTNWIASMQPFPFQYPDCSITYEYTARIYIYDCI